jgi:hypothetical protein
MEYFQKHTRTFMLVLEGGNVCGLIGRDKLFLSVGSKEGWDLYADRPISTFMDKTPLFLDCAEKSTEVYQKVISRSIETVYDDVVVFSEGVLLGLVSVKQLMVCLFQDFERRRKQTYSNLKKPILATVMSEMGRESRREDDVVEILLKALENSELEPEAVAVPLPQAPSNSIKLRGHLDAFNIVELVQLLVQGEKTGRLDLLENKQENPFYSLYINKGRLTHAEGNGEWGKAALWKALKVVEGKFIFHYNLKSSKISIHDDPAYLLMEACRLQDEAAMAHPVREVIS